MSATAQRRTAAAAAIMMLLAVLQFVLFAVSPEPAAAAGPEPTYGAAVVDGKTTEWDLGADHFADLIRAGGKGGQTAVLGKSYLRYDCATSSLFVLALSHGDFDGLAEAWVKIYELGRSEANGAEAIVYDGDTPIGFETVVPNLAEGPYTVEIHLDSDGDTASNAKGGSPLTIQCPDVELEKVGVSVTGSCLTDAKGDGYGAVDITVDPDAGATVLFEGVEYTSSASGIVVEAPGWYPWSATAEPGFELEEPSTGTVEIEDCSETKSEPVSVTVSGTCVTADDGSDFGRLDVTITPAGGATLTIDAKSYTESTSGIVVDAGTSYGWNAVPADGYFLDGDPSGTVTIGECEETPPPPPPPVPTAVESALGDLVWFDENRNGQQDDPQVEFPINGATVTLLAPNGTVLAQQVTGLDGLYFFDQLDAGTYRVEVCVDGAQYTVTNAADVPDTADSDVFALGADSGCARTAIIHLPGGVTDLTWDAGLVIEVRGIQVESTTTTETTATTIAPVTVGTLPFTGGDAERVVVLAVSALAAGSLLLLASRRRDASADDAATMSGWSNT